MRIALDRLGLSALFASPTAHVLSHSKLVVAAWGYPRASSTMRSHTPCWALRNSAAYPDSPTMAATLGMTLLIAKSGPLIVCPQGYMTSSEHT